ncbi:LysR family transcriptional regulator [Burkholderia sp. MSh2]|uniref:LysR family transcriptional regulator n=1 Tax=Burkholderia paludis TaxID=1506587 RepID=A0A6P2Q4P6_9BURK|nr:MULTISPECIES: LysR family transcriptional regulator [Burkholderia]KEZ06384.1 LysR family transcriptional regulator [Burkholderia sp. MSh2]KFG97701.1 LysR family transcriptional regulator [Burkholderia paludis]CAB3769762.1 HTH-type transcriptional regulator DmlR [Burkholderia paludis]VWC17480.1 LysR family transcriptional regulator [Burkholderia paludis]
MDQLQSIRAFVTVAREGGFRRAATRLRVSTAMASRLVDALETRLGARLLQRSTCHQSLTEIGELYLVRVERILGAIDEIDGRFVAMGSKPEGELRIAAPVAFGLSRLSALLDRFVDLFPDVRPIVTLTDAHVDLTSEDVDVAFLTDGMPVSGAYALHTLAAYESVRVAAPGYVAAHGGAAASVDWPDIATVRLELPAAGGETAALRHDTAPGSPGVGHLEMARRLAVAGMGAAVLPAYLVDADLAAGTLVRVAPVRPLAPVTLKLAHARIARMPAAARAFVEFAGAAFRPAS